MNTVAKKLFLIVASSALLLAGCKKKPLRPDPASTVLGQGGAGGTNLATSDISTVADPMSGLQQRPDGVIEDADTIRGLFKPVFFDLDKSNIKESERSKLQDAVTYLKDHPEQRLRLEGHCDWRGTAEYNLGLGDRRAASAKKYVTTLGLVADKSEVISKGSLEAVKNGDEAAMANDRRVDIIILKH